MRSACAGSARRSASRRCRSTRMSATRTTCSAGSPTSSSARSRSRRAGPDWKASLRATILGAREALLRHPWAPRVLESRAEPGPATLAYMDAVVGILRGGGFSIELTHHALHALGSRVLGFGQDLFDDGNAFDPAAAAQIAAALEPTHPTSPRSRGREPRGRPRRLRRRLRVRGSRSTCCSTASTGCAPGPRVQPADGSSVAGRGPAGRRCGAGSRPSASRRPPR